MFFVQIVIQVLIFSVISKSCNGFRLNSANISKQSESYNGERPVCIWSWPWLGSNGASHERFSSTPNLPMNFRQVIEMPVNTGRRCVRGLRAFPFPRCNHNSHSTIRVRTNSRTSNVKIPFMVHVGHSQRFSIGLERLRGSDKPFPFLTYRWLRRWHYWLVRWCLSSVESCLSGLGMLLFIVRVAMLFRW